MANKITKTKPMSKSKNSALATMRAQAEIHQAQLTAFRHGATWALAEAVWNHFSDEDFDHTDLAHWQGASYRLGKEIAILVVEGLKILPALVVKNLTNLTVLPPV